MAIWPAIRGVGLRQRGGVSRIRRCRQRSGEWGVGSGAPSSALAEATTAAVKTMPAKAGAPSSNLEVKFLNSRAVRPTRQSSQPDQPGNLGLLGHLGNLGQPGQPGEAPCRASREIGACRAVKPAGKSGPAGLAGRRTTPRQPGQAAGKKPRRPERNHAWPQRKRAGHKEIKIPLGNLQ